MNQKNTMAVIQWILIVGYLLSLSGCWDLEEVDRRVFATTIGIDLNRGAGDQVELSVQVPQPAKMLPPGARTGEAGKKFSTITVNAATVLDAFSDLQTKTNGELVVQQNKSIILGAAAARRDVTPLLEWLLRSPTAPPQALILVARNRKAKDVLTFEPALENLPGLDFVQTAQAIAKYDRTYFIPVWKFNQKLVHGSKDAYAPLIGVDPSEKQYIIAGLALFNGTRMVGELGPAETQSFGILANLMRAGSITIGLDERRKLTLRNVGAHTRLKVSVNHGKLVFLVTTKVGGSLSEFTGGYMKLSSQENRRLEEIITTKIRSGLDAVIHKLQHLNSDTIDFGEQLRVQRPDVWERLARTHAWKKVFPTVPFRIVLNVRIQRDGVLR